MFTCLSLDHHLRDVGCLAFGVMSTTSATRGTQWQRSIYSGFKACRQILRATMSLSSTTSMKLVSVRHTLFAGSTELEMSGLRSSTSWCRRCMTIAGQSNISASHQVRQQRRIGLHPPRECAGEEGDGHNFAER